MKHVFALLLAMSVTACQAQEKPQTDIKTEPEDSAVPTPQNPVNISVPQDGRISLTAETLLPEDSACVLPLRISNGTDKAVSVSMFGFAVTGPGDADTGNMFPQDIPSGQYRTARIIQIGQSCDAFDTITIKDIMCRENNDPETSCDVTFEDSDEIRFVNPN